VTPVDVPRCPRCAARALAEDRFCESCGAPLQAHAADSGADDRRQASATDRAAAVSDRGRVHHRNEDRFYLAADADPDPTGPVVAIVCDGVSSSASADIAARVAADSAGAVLRDGLSSPDPRTTMREAIAAANRAVLAIPWAPTPDRSAPSCTLVAALATDGMVTIGCVGDSRAYWFDAEHAQRLTRDHSWAEEQVGAGLLSEHDANADSRAHMITAWIGADAPDDPPQIVTFHPPRAGLLLLCSDGLWNYAPDPEALAALAWPTGDREKAPLAVAQRLADHALEAGGRDNITVAVIGLDGPTPDRLEQS